MSDVVPFTGCRALVVSGQPGGFEVVIRPARTRLEQLSVTSWPTRPEAFRYAKRLQRMFSNHFTVILDECEVRHGE